MKGHPHGPCSGEAQETKASGKGGRGTKSRKSSLVRKDREAAQEAEGQGDTQVKDEDDDDNEEEDE